MLLPICASGISQSDSLLFSRLDSLLDANRFAEVIQLSEEASSTREAPSDEDFLADLYSYYFVAWFRLGEMDKAIEFAQQALLLDTEAAREANTGKRLS